jgi:hypothetical protein
MTIGIRGIAAPFESWGLRGDLEVGLLTDVLRVE